MKPAVRVGRHRLAVYGAATDETWGEADPALRVVLVHGTMDRATSLAKVSRRLPDLAVRRYDRRGYGESTTGPIPGSVEDHVEDLLAVIDGAPAAVVGHSMGGTIALAAAARHPGLIPAVGAYEAPRPWTRPDETAPRGDLDPAGAAERFMRRMIGDRAWDRLPTRVREARRAEGAALLADGTSIRVVPAYADDQLTMPVIAGHGSASGARHVEDATALVAQGAGRHLVVIEGAGHGAHITHPDRFADLVRQVVAAGRDPSTTQ